jgi:hypothetical protein
MSDVTELYDLRVTVERIEGRSVCGLHVGRRAGRRRAAHARRCAEAEGLRLALPGRNPL